MALMSFVFLICSLRVNLIFVLVLVGAVMGFSFLSAALFFESEALRLFGAAGTFQTAGNTAMAQATMAAGQRKLSCALKLVTVGATPILMGNV